VVKKFHRKNLKRLIGLILEGFIILGIFILFVFCCFFSFIGGWFVGRKQAAADIAQDQKIKAQTEKDFDQLRETLFKGGKPQ
jgi:uncharacterized protein YneF (UPF0154 family)